MSDVILNGNYTEDVCVNDGDPAKDSENDSTIPNSKGGTAFVIDLDDSGSAEDWRQLAAKKKIDKMIELRKASKNQDKERKANSKQRNKDVLKVISSKESLSKVSINCDRRKQLASNGMELRCFPDRNIVDDFDRWSEAGTYIVGGNDEITCSTNDETVSSNSFKSDSDSASNDPASAWIDQWASHQASSVLMTYNYIRDRNMDRKAQSRGYTNRSKQNGNREMSRLKNVGNGNDTIIEDRRETTHCLDDTLIVMSHLENRISLQNKNGLTPPSSDESSTVCIRKPPQPALSHEQTQHELNHCSSPPSSSLSTTRTNKTFALRRKMSGAKVSPSPQATTQNGINAAANRRVLNSQNQFRSFRGSPRHSSPISFNSNQRVSHHPSQLSPRTPPNVVNHFKSKQISSSPRKSSDVTGVKNKNGRSSSSLSSREANFLAWKRRQSYDPRASVARSSCSAKYSDNGVRGSGTGSLVDKTSLLGSPATSNRLKDLDDDDVGLFNRRNASLGPLRDYMSSSPRKSSPRHHPPSTRRLDCEEGDGDDVLMNRYARRNSEEKGGGDDSGVQMTQSSEHSFNSGGTGTNGNDDSVTGGFSSEPISCISSSSATTTASMSKRSSTCLNPTPCFNSIPPINTSSKQAMIHQYPPLSLLQIRHNGSKDFNNTSCSPFNLSSTKVQSNKVNGSSPSHNSATVINGRTNNCFGGHQQQSGGGGGVAIGVHRNKSFNTSCDIENHASPFSTTTLSDLDTLAISSILELSNHLFESSLITLDNLLSVGDEDENVGNGLTTNVINVDERSPRDIAGDETDEGESSSSRLQSRCSNLSQFSMQSSSCTNTMNHNGDNNNPPTDPPSLMINPHSADHSTVTQQPLLQPPQCLNSSTSTSASSSGVMRRQRMMHHHAHLPTTDSSIPSSVSNQLAATLKMLRRVQCNIQSMHDHMCST